MTNGADKGKRREWEFNGRLYGTRQEMREARRVEYVRLLDEEGMNFTQAARTVGVSKRTDKAWRNGRPRDRTARQPRFREPMVMTGERPAEIGDRAIPGHWEGALILGAGGQSAIGTLVERATRFVTLLHLPGRHDAETVQDTIIRKMRTLPEHLRNAPAWDQGPELALHKRITTALDMQVHFCDPHSPWQRGTNENTNGPLRQYFPKGTDLKPIRRSPPRRRRQRTRQPAKKNPRLGQPRRTHPPTTQHHKLT